MRTYIIREQLFGSDEVKAQKYTGSLRGAKNKATKNKKALSTELVIEDETNKRLCVKFGSANRWLDLTTLQEG